MSKLKRGYMCSVDYDWELGEAQGGVAVYPSVKDLKDRHKAWKSCGIVEVEVKKSKTVEKADLKLDAISSEDFARQERELRIKWFEEQIETLEADLEYKKNKLKEIKRS